MRNLARTAQLYENKGDIYFSMISSSVENFSISVENEDVVEISGGRGQGKIYPLVPILATLDSERYQRLAPHTA
jgi:hypothetical protein